MILVLVLFAIARFLGGRQPGQLSTRQARRIRARSARDLTRFERTDADRPGERPDGRGYERLGAARSTPPPPSPEVSP